MPAVIEMFVLSDQHVYLRTRGGNHYLVTTSRVCRNLQRSYRSGDAHLVNFGRRVCPADGSHFLYRWGGNESFCPIQTIDVVDDRTHAREIASGGGNTVEMETIILPD